MSVAFYLGVHRPHWLGLTDVPLFVSRTTIAERRRTEPPRARGPWALDSGAYTELRRHGEWSIGPAQYAREVRRLADEVGFLSWAAPQDWMCEPAMLDRTRQTVREHQRRTVGNFLDLRQRLGPLVIPVLQGQTLDDYLLCAEMYERRGVSLSLEPIVGVGTVCRRQSSVGAATIIRRLADEGLRLHGFGVKLGGLAGRYAYWDALVSADSMAWSYRARKAAREGKPSCDPAKRKACANCLHFALEWYEEKVLPRLDPAVQPLWQAVAA